jgi:hypothetical protein
MDHQPIGQIEACVIHFELDCFQSIAEISMEAEGHKGNGKA